jgi:hypothetical protein
MTINFNIDPYWDDFDDTKNYQRILFRPGYAVQARELTQLQTQLQDQIKKFGKHVFVNGSVVLGGNRLFDLDLTSIKLNTYYSGATVVLSNFAGKTIEGASSKTKAIVKAVVELDGTDPKTLLVSIISGGSFTAGENITTVETSSHTATTQSSASWDPATKGMSFSIDSGVFFVDGKFIYLEPQSIAIDKYTNTSSKRIGFVLNEEAITSDDDSTILDNAQGTPNYAAPGADRYKASLTLQSLPIIDYGATGATDTNKNFIEIARIVDGKVAENKAITVYSELGKELARRTYDESGDYTVQAWPIQISDDVTSPPDSTKFTVALDPGTAYVKGFYFKTENQKFITLDRAREYEQVSGIDIDLYYGNYVYITALTGPFLTNIDTDTITDSPYTSVQIHNAAKGSVSNDSTLIGTAKVRFLKLYQTDPITGTAGGDSIYKMYLFDIVMNAGKSFKDARSIISGTGAVKLAAANIDNLSRYTLDNSTFTDAFLGGSDSPGLVFPMPNKYVKTVKDKDGNSKSKYRLQRTFLKTIGSGGKITISLTGNETFYPSAKVLSDDEINQHYHVVIQSVATGSIYAPGDVAEFSGSRSVEIKDAGKTIEFNFADAGFSGTAIVIATINANSQAQKTKTRSDYKSTIVGTTEDLNTTIGGKDSLKNSDIYDIKHVYITTADPSSVDVNPTTGEVTDWKTSNVIKDGGVPVDYKARYILDNGQRAEFYDHGNLILNGTAPNSSHYLYVIYRNFTHDKVGYSSVDSYTNIDYADIPKFTDPSSGIVYELRDCIDFRPRRDDGATTLSYGQVPAPTDSTLNADYQYYLSRIDKIIATQDQTFIVKKGISAVTPQAPIDESNGMTIYAIVIPPYTGNVRDVQIKYVENRRYTMRDIGRIEKRISNLEYYTQLSLLEKQAKDTSIKGANTLDKFKNGFATDPFTSADVFAAGNLWATRRWGWWNAWFNGSNTWNQSSTTYNVNSLADVANIDFAAAIDPANQELRAPFIVSYNQFDVGATGAQVNTARYGDLVTLTYTEDVAIEQPLASTWINVNPFNVIRFIGTLTLEPAFDTWIDTFNLPDTNLMVDTLMPSTVDQTSRIDNNATRFHSEAGGHPWHVASTNVTFGSTVLSTETTSGTTIVDVQSVPFIRASRVLGIGKLFKPKARLYPFIENTSISSYVKPLKILRISTITGSGFIDKQGAYETITVHTSSSSGTQTGTAKVAIYSQESTTIIGNRLLTISDETGTSAVGQYVVGSTSSTVGKIEEIFTGSTGGSLIPDEFGNLGFEFDIPANTFKTGERTIRLIDNSANDVEHEQSIGQAKYTATGQIQSKQKNILTTRLIQNTKTTVEVGYYDPIAQSFIIEPKNYPLGLHVSSVEVYFKSKSNTVPIELQIRNNVNGYPESQPTIPFSSVILTADKVSVSDSGATSTKFTLDNPIHLTPGDYSIVLLANTQEYEVFVANIGDIIPTPILNSGKKIDSQPYIGSLFKSQNASTWEADQNKDLKFKVNRAVFSGATGYAEFTIQDPDAFTNYGTLFTHVSSILPTGANIKWYSKSYKGTANGATGASYDVNTPWLPLNVNQDVTYTDLRQLDLSGHAGGSTLKLQAVMYLDPAVVTKNEVSPAIDVASLAAITAVNDINNDSSYEAGYGATGATGSYLVTAGGNAIAKYISKAINLSLESSNICVTVDINKPQGTDVKVYYRTLPTEKTSSISDENWHEMVLENTVTISSSSYDFKEHKYFPSNAFNGNLPVDRPISPRFNAFQIKIVLLSSSAAYTPRLRDLRVIALDT